MRWLFMLAFLLPVTVFGQERTVGLFLNSEEAENGYTLFTRHEAAYLVDNCGHVVHTWQSELQQGGVLYLLDNGDLLRASRIPAQINGVPGGGLIVRYDWDGDILWKYEYAHDTHQHHHDIEPMPNGNVLLLAWNYKSPQEAMDNGRDPSNMSPLGILYESVVEIRPIGQDSGEIVWEWHMWDHLVQNQDSSKLNYGEPVSQPGRIDLNFNDYNGSYHHDWIHANAIGYNAAYDEIAISARNFSEVWVIDHSTTTEEATSSTGGKHGKGGEIVYRWGNPQAYGHGDWFDRALYGQHDVKFINRSGSPGDAIMVFNNGAGRDTAFSDVVVIDLPRDSNGLYIYKEGLPYAPHQPSFAFSGTPEHSLYSKYISSAEFLRNGNLFVCEGNKGRFTEWSPDGKLVWEYLSPLDNDGIVAQGEEVDWPDAFRAYRFDVEHPALRDKPLEPGAPVEIEPWPDSCEIYEGSSTVEVQLDDVRLVNSIAHTAFVLDNTTGRELYISLSTMGGRVVTRLKTADVRIELPATNLQPGMYLISATVNGTSAHSAWKVIVPI